MNKNQKISKCLNELRIAHCSWWKDIAEREGIGLRELELKGYVERRPESDDENIAYEITKEGLDFIEKNPVYRRPSLHEFLHGRMGVVRYRGKRISVYSDDPGQQFYFYYKGECVGCGAFNPYYEDYIKSYLDDKMDRICSIDTDDFPGMRARLEYRAGKNGRRAKYLILSDRQHGLIDKPIYVGSKKTKNEECVETAKYIMSILQLQYKREEEMGGETNGG